MDITILGYKINLEILILIGVIYLILVGHTFCSCCHFGFMEGLQNIGNTMTDKNVTAHPMKELATQTVVGPVRPSGDILAKAKDKKNNKTATTASTEGFAGANINYGESSLYDINKDDATNTSNWFQPNMTVSNDMPISQGVKDFLARKPQPVPLPKGEMLMFANTEFKPECCSNTYSNSSGCACMTGQQYNYLITRGSNNVPYSEY